MVNNGTLAFNAATAFLGNAQINLASGTTLDTRGINPAAPAIGIVVGSVTGSGTITNFSLNAAGTLTTGLDNSNTTFSGVFTSPFPNGLLSVTKIGTGTWNLSGNSSGNLVSNILAVNNGIIALDSGSGNSINFRNYTLNSGGKISLDNTSTNVSNRLGSASYTDISTSAAPRTFTLAGGTLSIKGSSSGFSENIGALTLTNGGGIIDLNAGSGGSNVLSIFSLSTIAGSATGGTLLLRGTNLGGTVGGANVSNLTVTSVAIGTLLSTTPQLIGGSGAVGSTTMSIRPDIIGDTTTDINGVLIGKGTGFVTYIGSGATVGGFDGGGFRLLTAAELTVNSIGTQPTLAPWAAPTPTTINASVSSAITMTASTTTVNSLTLSNAGGVIMGAANVPTTINPETGVPNGSLFSAAGALQSLIVTSGGILSLPTTSGTANIIAGGVLTTNTTNQLIFHTVGDLIVNSFLTMGAAASGTIVKSSDGTLTLNRRSFIGGSTVVNGGTLELNSGPNTLMVVPTTTTPTLFDLRMNAGTVDLMGFNQAVKDLSNNNPQPNTGGTVTNSGSASVNFFINPSTGEPHLRWGHHKHWRRALVPQERRRDLLDDQCPDLHGLNQHPRRHRDLA